MNDALLQRAVLLGVLRPVDLHFARRMQALAGGGDDHNLLLAAALASHRVGEGDVCVALDACADFPLFRELGGAIAPPEPNAWVAGLRRSPVVGCSGGRAPLILDHARRLYLGRYWHFERVLADALESRAGTWVSTVDRARLRAGLDRLFRVSWQSADGTDWQRIATAVSILRPLCVISGGPGTGKTHTVTSILALLVEQAAESPPRIALTAPTGKAAARLTESIRKAKQTLNLPPQIADAIPEDALTLHRLLGFRPGRANPRHGLDNPLHLDVLVVDEASMVDLPLMARLLDALSAKTRLVLLGDKDQLASVEAGMVLGDICGRGAKTGYGPELVDALHELGTELPVRAATSEPGIADHIVHLEKSRRFAERSGIGALSRAVNAGEANRALDVLADDGRSDVELITQAPRTLAREIDAHVVPRYREVLDAPSPQEALEALNRMRVLCAVREGPYGLSALNRQIEQALEATGVINSSGDVYAGRPVIVTANDHAQRLYNGDVGLILRDVDSHDALRVFFATADGLRRILPARLPPHETVYAMTVHKSQGSEFDQVLLILPDAESRVVTRELLYTGITRARKKVRLIATEERLREAISRQVKRSTGLFDALWG